MKQKFTPVICAIVIALTFLSNTVIAQSLLIGQYPGVSESLLGVRYRKMSNPSNQSGAVFSGIPDLNNNNKASGDFGYGNSGSFSFTITFNSSNNTFTTVTTINDNPVSTSFANVSGNLSNAGKIASANSINMMNLAVTTPNNATLTVSNLTIDGMPISGSYSRNSNGTSNWHIASSNLTGGFVVTGTVTMSGTMGNGNEAQMVEFGFANSSSAPGPLPVVWGGFAGKRVNNSTVALQWRTMQEQNASHYNVQRSEDGIRFRTIAIVAAQGTTSSVSDYNFDDKNATAATHFYRLEQVDLDGSINYSSIIKQGNGGQKTLVGGLGSNKIMVQFFSNDNRQFRIVNNSGIIVKQMNSTTQQQVLDVNNLSTGVYALQIINSDGTSEVHRFVK
ncbi:T9SS type A sorting domain-containing protein [Lacibacter sp. H407]|uniref:T9SS type A sorting domain-containing protein n=1 Tax=Lacibacter sp. H407 TaxID=3133423 RepID=UPI0030BD9998